MHRVRNAVVIIVLCIIGAMTFKSRQPQLTLTVPSNDIKDAVAGGPVHTRAPHLTLASGSSDDLRDSVAGHAVGTPGGKNGNTLDDVPPPPRGSGNGGFGSLQGNPGQNQNPPVLSPSTPGENGGGENGGGETGGACNEGNGQGNGQGCINGNRDHDKH